MKQLNRKAPGGCNLRGFDNITQELHSLLYILMRFAVLKTFQKILFTKIHCLTPVSRQQRFKNNCHGHFKIRTPIHSITYQIPLVCITHLINDVQLYTQGSVNESMFLQSKILCQVGTASTGVPSIQLQRETWNFQPDVGKCGNVTDPHKTQRMVSKRHRICLMQGLIS